MIRNTHTLHPGFNITQCYVAVSMHRGVSLFRREKTILLSFNLALHSIWHLLSTSRLSFMGNIAFSWRNVLQMMVSASNDSRSSWQHFSYAQCKQGQAEIQRHCKCGVAHQQRDQHARDGHTDVSMDTVSATCQASTWTCRLAIHLHVYLLVASGCRRPPRYAHTPHCRNEMTRCACIVLEANTAQANTTYEKHLKLPPPPPQKKRTMAMVSYFYEHNYIEVACKGVDMWGGGEGFYTLCASFNMPHGCFIR